MRTNPTEEEGLPTCEQCGGIMEVYDSGYLKNIVWMEYRCPECGFWYSEEPDYDQFDDVLI
jgi:C4-type Zn-finger protein